MMMRTQASRGISAGLGGIFDFDFAGANGGIGSTIPDTIYSTGGSTDKFSQIINVISQGLAAFGKNPTTQVGSGVSAIYPQQQQQPVYTTQQTGTGSINTSGGAGTQAVGALTGTFDSIASSFGLSPTTLALVAAGGAYLLLREPPRRR